jgi:hypothetical protein
MKAIFRAIVYRFEYLLNIKPAPLDSSNSGFNRLLNQKILLGFTLANTPETPEESPLINNPYNPIKNMSKYGTRGSKNNQNNLAPGTLL